jgi:hypothetical protein
MSTSHLFAAYEVKVDHEAPPSQHFSSKARHPTTSMIRMALQLRRQTTASNYPRLERQSIGSPKNLRSRQTQNS